MSAPFSNNPSDILSAWLALEILSPQTFRKRSELATSPDYIIELTPTLPWETRRPSISDKHRAYYKVILATLDFSGAIERLLDLYPDDRPEKPSAGAAGEAIIGVLLVDDKGLLIGDPAMGISSFAWGLPHALKKDLHTLANWPVEENDIRLNLDKRLRKTGKHGEVLPIDSQSLQDARQALIKALGLPVDLVTDNTFAILDFIYIPNEETPEPPLLNSFFVNDLIRARQLIAEDKATHNLQRYLGQIIPKHRFDLLHDKEALEAALAPANIPSARWPGPGRHSLVLLQQAAVNLALKNPEAEDILAVNGPPGTGKTTLLRDIVAGVVVQRAEQMLEFNDPAKAFRPTDENLKLMSATLRFYELDARLKGHEILIASSNNKAVENISAELPALDAIAEDAEELRYFNELSDDLLERETWGLIAAVLGNAKNRSRFRQTFWWHKELGMATYLTQATRTREEALARWEEARQRFRRALERSEKELKSLEKLRKAFFKKTLLSDKIQSAETNMIIKGSEHDTAKADHWAAQVSADAMRHALADEQNKISRHHSIRPGFFARLFRTQQYKDWKAIHDDFSRNMRQVQEFVAEEEAKMHAHAEQMVRIEAAQEAMNKLLQESKTELEDLLQDIQALVTKHDGKYLDTIFFTMSHKEKHLISPWCDKKVQRLRDDVFTAAMALHKAFIDAAAKPIKHNVGILMNIFGGMSLSNANQQKLLPDLWSSLFMIVPAVSTTFASMERMFPGLDPGSLGWLLIDEAGQALPQAAVGALMRTKRAVVVGDPLQIEPVVTLPNALTKNICREFNIDPGLYNAPEASTQTLADAATPYYAEFEGRYGSRAVGLPLLVHRRCADPMFSISNAIAYEGLMVQAKVAAKRRPIRDVLGPSKWIDIQSDSQHYDDKYSPEEGQVVIDLLTALRDARVAPNLYIITPFRQVADQLSRDLRRSQVIKSWPAIDAKWITERVGTVHTAQGREAEAIIMVLGAPDPAQKGARAWAGARPNLLNVAVTRAKESIYVIGNRELWQSAGLMSELARMLPDRSGDTF